MVHRRQLIALVLESDDESTTVVHASAVHLWVFLPLPGFSLQSNKGRVVLLGYLAFSQVALAYSVLHSVGSRMRCWLPRTGKVSFILAPATCLYAKEYFSWLYAHFVELLWL